MPSQPRTQYETALLDEARQFLLARARELQAMLAPSRELRQRLAATEAFKRVDGLDAAGADLLWDAWATLDACFERGIDEIAYALRSTVRRVQRSQ